MWHRTMSCGIWGSVQSTCDYWVAGDLASPPAVGVGRGLGVHVHSLWLVTWLQGHRGEVGGWVGGGSGGWEVGRTTVGAINEVTAYPVSYFFQTYQTNINIWNTFSRN